MKWKKVIIKNYPLEKKVKESGLSLRELEKKSGVNFTYWQKVLSGKIIASEKMAGKMVKVLE